MSEYCSVEEGEAPLLSTGVYVVGRRRYVVGLLAVAVIACAVLLPSASSVIRPSASGELAAPPAQANVEALERKVLHSLGKFINGKACAGQRTQVFTDVDDTFKSSDGHWPAGCDSTYGKGVVYPGFAQFILELSRTASENTTVLTPAAMSARPRVARVVLGMKQASAEGQAVRASPVTPSVPDQYDAVAADMPLLGASSVQAWDYQDETRALGPWKLNTEGSMYGSITDGTSHASMGITKFNNFKDYFLSHDASDTCVIFIGDDGQGDCNPGAQQMRKFGKSGAREHALKAAFIHTLNNKDCSSKRPCHKESGHAPLFKFDTYLEAAGIALSHGLISGEGYLRVERSVRSFFDKYCLQSKSKAPDIVSHNGCTQLVDALLKAFPKLSNDTLDIDSRSLERLKGFCRHCCKDDSNGSRSSSKHDFAFEGFGYGSHNTFKCSDMYATVPWLNPFGSAASDAQCNATCSVPIPLSPP